MVDEVEEVLTVTPDQLESVPTANADYIEAIAKIDDRLVILLNREGLFADAVARDELAGGLSHARTRPPRSASSSPTTPGSCGACSPTPWAGRASRSWASRPTATRRWRCAGATVPTR